ncbi:MAG: phosphoglucosamine mutase [Candidatus Omnitrophota bacterium]
MPNVKMKQRLFGTDGIRAKVGDGIFTRERVKTLGWAIGLWLTRQRQGEKKILIGRDTRKSGPMLEEALAAGLMDYGISVVNCDVLPTPAIAHLTGRFGFDLGIVISASHNTWEYNGIKCFDTNGFKLPDKLEDEIEIFIHENDGLPIPKKSPATKKTLVNFKKYYLDHLLNAAEGLDLGAMKLVVDCANGAASAIAPKLFETLGARAIMINASPNGTNINDKCGSLFTKGLHEAVLSHNADLGLALDGDGDRLIGCDELANTLDGDYFMSFLAKEMIKDSSLAKNTLVVTQMSNIAVDVALSEAGGRAVRTDVGDKFVFQRMQQDNLNFGGEQSGHMIFLDDSTTGDGLISAIRLLKAVKRNNKPASELFGWFKKYPQVLVNIRVGRKTPFEDIPGLCSRIEMHRELLGDKGRIFVRYSGTEPLARVMVEGPKEDTVREIANSIASCFND